MPQPEVAIPAWVADDVEWASTVHVMSAPALLSKRVIETYVDFDHHSIEWDMLQKAAGAWSHGERLLADLAYGFWTARSSESPPLIELVSTLDDANLAHVLEAVRIRRRWTPLVLAEKAVPAEDLRVRIDFLAGRLVAIEDELRAEGMGGLAGFGLSAFAINVLGPLSTAIENEGHDV